MTPPLYTLREGGSPLIVSIPHAGTFLPADIAGRLTPAGLAVPDTDWHVDRLLGFLADLDVTVLTATHSRIVVDLNRAPDGALLYPGQAETGICPTESFRGDRFYAGDPPDRAEVAARVGIFWQPYHDELQCQIDRLCERHGGARLLDAHSIHGAIPRLFAGPLPDLNVGTHDGSSAGAPLTGKVMAAVAGPDFSSVLNGRFKGGYITRHYGRPDTHIQGGGIEAVQLELAWRTYLDEDAPKQFSPARAARLTAVLRRVVTALLAA